MGEVDTLRVGQEHDHLTCKVVCTIGIIGASRILNDKTSCQVNIYEFVVNRVKRIVNLVVTPIRAEELVSFDVSIDLCCLSGIRFIKAFPVFRCARSHCHLNLRLALDSLSDKIGLEFSKI